MAAATSPAVTGPGKVFCETSGRRMLGIRHERLYPITMNIALTLAMNPYEHVREVLSGEVRVAGIDIVPLELPIEEIFYRFTKFREWQASQMSFGKGIPPTSEDQPGIISIPVFLARGVRH